MNEIQTRETRVSTARGQVYAKLWGEAATGAVPLVLLHDSLGCVELWRDFPLRLAAATGRAVIAYDRIGYGQSDPHAGPQPFTFIGDEAQTAFKAVLGHFAIRDFIVFGHSVGGCMAAEIAAQWPEACRALVTESAQTFVEARTIEGIEQARELFARPGQLDKLARYHGAKARWVLDAWIDTWLSPQFADWTLEAPLGRVHCPTLAIHGENDEYGSTEHPRRIAALVRGPSRAEVIADCGHLPHREMPERILALLVDWLGLSGLGELNPSESALQGRSTLPP